MAVVTVQRQKQRSLIGVMAFVLITTFLVLYFGLLKRGAPAPEVSEKEAEIFRGTREIKLNLAVLYEERFKELVPYERLSRKIKTGRVNPFAPYSVAEPSL